MRTSLKNNKITKKASQGSSNEINLSNLPVGATRLDPEGRIVHRVNGPGYSEEPRCIQMAGENFFNEYCQGTPLEHLRGIFEDGVKRGELYHFVDITIAQGEASRDLTLFLYYHASTAQGWVFVEPRNAESLGEEWELPEAA